MTMSQTQYAELRPPRLTGLWGLSLAATALLVVAAIVLAGIVTVGMVVGLGVWTLIAGAVWVLLALGGILPEAIKTRDGQGHYTKWFAKRAFRRGEKTGETVLSQGLTGTVPSMKFTPPGVAATTTLSEHYDIHGNPFGLITWGDTNLYSVVINTHPAGPSGKDSDVFDAEVAQWAAWKGQLNTIGNVVAAQVVIESSPDSGQRLARAVDRGRAEDPDRPGEVDPSRVPEFSRLMAEQIKASGSTGAPRVTTRVTVTFSGEETDEDTGEVHTRTAAEMQALIADVLPGLVSTLVATGAGSSCRAARAEHIIDFTRVAYDPSVAALVEEAQLNGGTGLTWDEAGPTTAVNRFDHYQHEMAWSRTWQMRQPPKGTFFATVLKRLLEPHRDIARKRVALCYRTESPLKSAQIAENDVTAARVALSQSPQAKAAQEQRLIAAKRTAEQEALGAPLIRVGMLITATVTEREQLDRVSRLIQTQLAPQARLRLRLASGAQDSAFVAALPLGMVPAKHAGLSGLAEQV